eukprot:gene12822-15047_t
MDQLLEAVSDAVSSMVLYSVEADESNAAIPNILANAQMVKSTVDYLVEIGTKSAEYWNNFSQPEMRLKMIETCQNVAEAMNHLVESATVLTNMPFNKPAKRMLLKGCKGIMEHMVVLLQQADLYEVTRMIRAARKVEAKLKIFTGLESGEAYFTQAAQDFVTSTVDVGKIVTKRTNEIDDFGYKRRFEEANTSLKVEVPIVLQYYAYFHRDPNDKQALAEGARTAQKIYDIIDEIITVARLSAKSPFDLSMISGLDLRDEDDLRDAGILIAHERDKLLAAIESGDGKEASRALKAIKKGLNDQIVISKALAKSADNPIQRRRLEDAAQNAQRLLDGIIAEFGYAVEQLLAQPDNALLLTELHSRLHTIKTASDQMVTSSAKLSSNDVAIAQRGLERMIDRVRLDVERSDVVQLAADVPLLAANFEAILALADSLARTTDDPALKAHIENASRTARQRGTEILNDIDRLTAAIKANPQDVALQQELAAKLTELEAVGKALVKATSIGTATDLLVRHSALEEQLAALRQAALEGNKKEVQSALRSIRKGLYDEVNLAKSIARATDDPLLKEALEAAIVEADDKLQSMIEDLYLYANETVEDPSNPRAIQSLDDIIASIDRLNAGLLGAVSRDLVESNTRAIESKLSGLAHSIKAGDQQEAVAVLKSVIEDIKKQALVADTAASYIAATDENRAARVQDRARELTSTGPDLVKAVKGVLTEMTPASLGALVASINKVRDTNNELTNAVLLSTEQELVANAAKIDAEMRRIRDAIDSGAPVNMAEVNALVTRMSNQIRLAQQHASTLSDPKAKKHLLDATDNLNKLVKLLADAARNSLNNPAALRDLLDSGVRTNMALVDGSLLSAADELVYGTPNLVKLINALEEAIRGGDPDEIKLALKELQAELARQIFLARIAESSIDDPERKKLLQDAILQLESLGASLVPSVLSFLADPNNREAREGLNRLLRNLKDGVERVSAIASSSSTEHLEAKSRAVANEMARLEVAVAAGRSADANEHHTRALQGIKQQIALSKHIAEQTNNIAQRRAIVDLSDRLEKQALVLSQAVKESLANPGDAAAAARLAAATAATRTLMAQLVAASSNKVPEEQVAATAASIKHDLEHLVQAIAAGQPVAEALKEGDIRQKMEQLKAYADTVQDPFLKRTIRDTVNDLDRKLNETIRLAATNDKNKLKAAAEAAIVSSERVVKAATPAADERIIAQSVRLSETLDRVAQAAKKGDKTAVENNLTDAREDLTNVVQFVKLAADSSRDPHKKVALNEIAEKLRHIQQPLTNQASGAAERPNDTRAQQDLAATIAATKELLGRAAAGASNSEASMVEETVLRVNSDVNRIVAAVQSGDQRAIGEAVNAIQDAERRIQIVAGATSDPAMKQQLNTINSSLPLLAGAGNTALTQGKDANAMAQAKQIIATQSSRAIDGLSAALALANEAPEENIVINGTIVNGELDNLVRQAKKGDKNAVESFGNTSHKAASEQALLARALASQTKNAGRKQELLAKANALEQALPQLEALSKAPNTPVEKLEGLAHTMRVNNQAIVNEALAERAEKEAALKREQEVREQEERERREREEKERDDEVMAAALKIQEATKNLVKDNSEEGKLYNTAAGIAGLMRDLSDAARTNDKKGMIQCSKLLSDQVNIYLSQAKETAAKCTDIKLKEQIITNAQAARNFMVQLKIIAAVKAASEDDDTNANKQQLVKCAKGLAKAVVATINSVEIGRIRVKA